MNFTSNDMAIIIAMAIAVIGLSFTMPALGLTGDNASDPPEFNMSADRFDFAGDFPENPGTPSSGTLEWNETVTYNDNQVWLENDVASLTIHTTQDVPTAYFAIWNSTNVEADEFVTRTSAGTEQISLQEWIITVEFYDIETVDATAGEYNFKLDYNVEERSTSEGGFISSIPIVGGIFDVGSALAGIVGWIGSVIWWLVTFLFTITTNLLGMMYDVAIFGAGILVWIGGTYGSVISGASGWATIVLAIPSIILSLEFAKLIMILISLLPTT